jgi:hypothetical protein
MLAYHSVNLLSLLLAQCYPLFYWWLPYGQGTIVTELTNFDKLAAYIPTPCSVICAVLWYTLVDGMYICF